MRALITGIQGFAGSHLCEHLLSQGADIFGTHFPGETTLLPEDAARQTTLLPCDLRDRASVESVVRQAQPDVIYHLAAIAFVPQARQSTAVAFDTNVLGSVNLLEAVRAIVPQARVVVISSGEVYGKVSADQVPTSEAVPVRPSTYYAVTKASVELMAGAYCAEFGLRTVILRPFNHIGPRQSAVFVVPSFARQIAEIEKGGVEPVISVGNLEARRDFTDVRDMMRAYALAAGKCDPGVPYNIASGTVHSIRDVLDGLLALTKVKIGVRQDPARLRPSDIPIIQGDATRFRRQTGWAPTVPFHISLQDILDYWRRVA